MLFRSIWGSEKDGIIRPMMWIGPIHHLKPEPRKSLRIIDKQQLIREQNYKCNFCENKIRLYPYSTADADHIIPVCLGGKTTMDNMQLLCVGCHRQKSACELKSHVKEVRGTFETDQIFIGKSIIFKFPCEKMTPKEILESEMNELCLLTYTKVNRFTYKAIDFNNFRYKSIDNNGTVG